MTDASATLAAAVQGEDAAIFAYGVIGAKLTGAARTLAEQSEVEHRNWRDQIVETTPSAEPPSSAFYQLPNPVTDTPSALKAAIAVEERLARLWRAVVVAYTGDIRKSALTALTDGALRAAAFRRFAGTSPGTVPFPGL